VVRAATKIVEDELKSSGAFQYLAILHQDRLTGIRDDKREFGMQIEIRCWESKDAVVAKPTRLSHAKLEKLGKRISSEIPGVCSVTYNITTKPPSTIEAV
jgi:GMP synthase (glutamine-hydrolysing)